MESKQIFESLMNQNCPLLRLEIKAGELVENEIQRIFRSHHSLKTRKTDNHLTLPKQKDRALLSAKAECERVSRLTDTREG